MSGLMRSIFLALGILGIYSQAFGLIFYGKIETHNNVCMAPNKGRPHIKIVYTAALIEHSLYQSRLQEYIASLKTLLKYGYEPYVIESCSLKGPTFFEAFTPFVFYWNSNEPDLINKGVNELNSLIAGCLYYAFDDDDMIIKLTGRYHMDTRKFLDLVEENPDIDVIYTARYQDGTGVCTGCFAMRYRLFIEMLFEINIKKMKRELIDFENEVESFIKKLSLTNIKYVKEIDVTANVAGGGHSGTPRTIFY
jgi:hypothetical protein